MRIPMPPPPFAGLLQASRGGRLGELLNLRLADIDSNRMVVRVSNGKGNKARDTLLAERALKLLQIGRAHV